MLVGVRSLPVGDNVPAAIELIKQIKIYPLNPPLDWKQPTWPDLTPMPQDTTPLAWENNYLYWVELNEVIQTEPLFPSFASAYGELTSLGIEKSKPFQPDARLKVILENAAKLGLAQMRAQSFADRRPERFPWKDRKWEWAALRF